MAMARDERERNEEAGGGADDALLSPADELTAAGAEAGAPLPVVVTPSVEVAQAVLKERKREGLRPGQEPRRQMKVGRVVSDKMDKTVIVVVEYTRQHRLYKKAMKRSSKFAAHDERNECRIGDIVRIEETRPLSKTKRWIVREVVQRRLVV